MSLRQILISGLLGSFGFIFISYFFGKAVVFIAGVLTTKAPRVRQGFDDLTKRTGNENQDALIALVVTLPIWLPSALITYSVMYVNPSSDEKIGMVLGIFACMAWILCTSVYRQKS